MSGKAVNGSFGINETLPTEESAVKVPADMLGLGDSYIGWINGVIDDGLIGLIGRSWTNVGPYTAEQIARTVRDQSRRHGGLANVVFCDGHVEGMKFQPLLFDESDAALSRWHVDHEPHRELFGGKR